MTRLQVLGHLIKIALMVQGFAGYGKDTKSDHEFDSLWADVQRNIGGWVMIGNQRHMDVTIGEVSGERQKSIARSLAFLLSNGRFGTAEFSIAPGIFSLEVDGAPLRDRDMAARIYLQVMKLERAKLVIDSVDDIATRERKIKDLLILNALISK